MANYATYTLLVYNAEAGEQLSAATSIIEDLIEKYPDAGDAIDTNGNTVDQTSWPSMEQDMVSFSTLYPTVRFEMFEDGSGSGGDWQAYYDFLNGKMAERFGEMTFPEYDPEKLK